MRKEKPTGKEIAEKSKKIKLDPENSFETEKKGKKVKFTGVKIPPLNSLEELEEGQVIGVLESELESDKIPAGKHNVFIAKVKEEWHGYIETEGKIIAEADEVSVDRHYIGDHKKEKPKFKFIEGSIRFCFTVCLIGVWIFCLYSTRICITIG